MLRKLHRIMAKLLALTLIAVLSALSGALSPASALVPVRYVKPGGAVSGTCESWANACELRFALASVAVSGDQIWVAAGTYKPTDGADRTISFALKNGVAIYGGFAGTETSPGLRSPAANVTILSGDIGTAGDAFDNSYPVVVGGGTDSTALLDGFTITAGQADGDGTYGATYNIGGGIYNDAGNPILRWLILSGNFAADGGAMYNVGGSPVLTNVVFADNVAGEGGGMLNRDGSPTLTNVTFSGNSADPGPYGMAGGMENAGTSTPTLTNVTISGNHAGSCAAMENEDIGTNPTLTNVIMWGNPSDFEACNYADASFHISYSVVEGGCDSIYNAICGSGNLSTDPVLGPLADNGGFTQTMALLPGSSAIDAGTDGSCPSTDQRGVPRPQGLRCDIGAYEYLAPTVQQIIPPDGSQARLRPQIGVTLWLSDLLRPTGAFDPNSVSLTLDGSDVTAAARVVHTLNDPESLAALFYTPPGNLALGAHQAAITYPSWVGIQSQQWNFTVADIACALSAPPSVGSPNPQIFAPVEPPLPTMPYGPVIPQVPVKPSGSISH